jgi:protein SCO1
VRASRLLSAVLGLSLVSSGAACSGHPASRPTTSAGTVSSRMIPESVASLRFTDDQGRSVSLAALRGKTVVLTDFLSLCQEVCPLTSANLGRVQQSLIAVSQQSSVELVEVTVDPERDTQERLAAYSTIIGAHGNWRLLTGSATDVAALWKWFGVAYERQPEPSPPGTDWWTGRPLTYDVGHSDVLFFLDSTGKERYLITGAPDASAVGVPRPLASFLNDEGRSNLASPTAGAWTARDVESVLSWLTGHHISGG